ncbi:MAG: aminotransferase class IV, partial [Gemmatimonadaceae bacterium]
FESDRHLKRMWRGVRELRLNFAMSPDDLIDAHLRLLRENGFMDGQAYIYLQITRGAAPRTHHFPPADTPVTVYMSATRFVPPNELRATGVSAITYPDYRWTRCDLKTVNLLPAVMAKQNATDRNAWEAIFVRGAVITEGSHTNVFGVVDGELRTYPNSNFILPGITRDLVVELAHEMGVPMSETPIYTHEIPRLSELFVTGTTSDIMPIVRLDDAPVGNGKPGPIARRLHDGLVARLAAATPQPAVGVK